MGEFEHSQKEIYSKSVRAGKRIYFFDVKATKSDDYYITITESKRRFNNEQQKFFYEKHKMFLYKEDFDKFSEGLEEVVNYIKERKPYTPREEYSSNSNIINNTDSSTDDDVKGFTDVDFEDLLDKE